MNSVSTATKGCWRGGRTRARRRTVGNQRMDMHESCSAHSGGAARLDKRRFRAGRSAARRFFSSTFVCPRRAEIDHARLSHPHLRRACARAMSARPSACRAGSTASAIMAICCSSICAIITASPRSSPTPIRPRSRCSTGSASKSVVTIDGKVVARSRGDREPQPADRRDRGLRATA